MRNLLYVAGLVCLGVSAFSCSDLEFGSNFLDQEPENSGATVEVMFSSRINSEKVLTKVYTYLPYGLPTNGGLYNKLGWNILESLTDINYSFRNNISDGPVGLYYNGALSANIPGNVQGCEAYRYGGEVDWYAIRYAWLYIENLPKVPDMSEAEKNERIAEAKTILALSYADMLRNIGGVPWLDHAVDVNEEMHFPRITFAQTVTNIVALLDEAIPHLAWKQDAVNDGRMTKVGAMALKLRVLLFAASPTFNSATRWHPEADEYTCYTDYDPERWKAAVKAGEQLMAEIGSRGGYGLIQPEAPTHAARRKAYQQAYYDRGGTEVLISTRRGFTAAHDDFHGERYYSGPTLNYVDLFPWEDGSDFPAGFDWAHPSRPPFFAADGTPTRDPRLYENVAVPGDLYWNGKLAPVYIQHVDYKEGSGFRMMKFILPNSSDRANRPTQWPYLRLPEVLLSYAEAINEYKKGPDAEAYRCVNDVRARVGLGPLPAGLSQAGFREAVLRERALELGFEEVRWYDLVRWGMEKEFRKKLYGLYTKGNDNLNPTEYTFKKVELKDRYWCGNWDTKWYLAPIPQNEINKKYGMTQNPGW